MKTKRAFSDVFSLNDEEGTMFSWKNNVCLSHQGVVRGGLPRSRRSLDLVTPSLNRSVGIVSNRGCPTYIQLSYCFCQGRLLREALAHLSDRQIRS